MLHLQTVPADLVRNPYWAVDAQGNQLPYLDRLVMDIKTNNLIASPYNGEFGENVTSATTITPRCSAARRRTITVYHWKPSTQSLFTVFPN